MTGSSPLLLAVAVALLAPAAASPRQAPPRPACAEWHECRQMALNAAARGDYEAFHDLAWRAVQTGPAADPDLMYLLARAQSLSGRPHDALVMLGRLAERGVWTDASTNDDFRRVRALAGWPAVAEAIDRARSGSPAPVRSTSASVSPVPSVPPSPVTAPVPAPSVAVPAPALPATSAEPTGGTTSSARERPTAPLPIVEAPAEEAARFATEPFAPGGLAYDGVSRRFVFGDLGARKLKIVAEGMPYTVTLVSAPSAGFHDVTALEIDTRRGDLWVVSAVADGTASALHKLQLVSGRPLATYEAPAALEPVEFVDVAVTPAGVVFVLDAAGRRVLSLRPGKAALEEVASLGVADPASLAPSGDRAVYVAHRDGIARVDLRTRAVQPLVAPANVPLGGFDWIRRHGDSLIGVQRGDDDTRRVVRLTVDSSGRAVAGAMVIRAPMPALTAPAAATIAGDDLYYLARSDGASSPSGAPVEIVIERLRLSR